MGGERYKTLLGFPQIYQTHCVYLCNICNQKKGGGGQKERSKKGGEGKRKNILKEKKRKKKGEKKVYMNKN